MNRLKKTVLSVSFAVLLIIAAAFTWFIWGVPSSIVLSSGTEGTLTFGLPVTLVADDDARSVVGIGGDSLSDVTDVEAGEKVKLTPRSAGEADMSVSVFGIPVKDITVTVEEDKKLVPGGQSIGVMLYTKGALVVGTMDVKKSDGSAANPAKDAGLLAGDIIEELNGQEINDAAHLTKLINGLTGPAPVHLTVKRGEKELSVTITPVTDSDDGLLKMGVWVRDSTVGVGTMSFYDPETKTVAGLGHAIEDIDTGTELSVKEGEIAESQVIEVKKGEAGEPGELKGAFGASNRLIANIEKNSEFGIYGKASKAVSNPLYKEALPICKRGDVKTGDATILTTVDGSGVAAYGCRIVRLYPQSSPQQKSFVIEVTDKKLLDITGGIVQGMSGSPVIQDGKIVGAVTHVFLDDPRMGYGVYIEWMLDEAAK